MTPRPFRSTRLVLAAVAVTLSTGVPSAYADPAHDLVVNCDASVQQSGNFAFVGYATAPTGHTPPTSMILTCSYTNSSNRFISISSMPGPLVMTFGGDQRLPGATTVCGNATATYADGHTGSGTQACHIANLVPAPSGSAP
jgi:hypothetical protein